MERPLSSCSPSVGKGMTEYPRHAAVRHGRPPHGPGVALMNEPLARSLMTSQVTTIPPEMPVADIARLLAEHGISAVPVVAMDGSLLGLVTEADLICRLAAQLDGAPSWLGALFADPAKAAERYARAHGFIAEEVMTTEVVTIPPDMPAAEIAATLERHRIRRVLVVERGRLLGVVSRRDLLRVV